MFVAFRLLMISLWVFAVINGQGAGGSSGRGWGGGRSSYRSGIRRGSSCRGPRCRLAGIIAGSVIGGFVGLALIAALIIYCCYRWRHRRSSSNIPRIGPDNPRHVPDQTDKGGYFKDGIWSSRYYQYGRWHGPHRVSLKFDRTFHRVTGRGHDDVGDFTIDGTFSDETSKLLLNKFYASGTGDAKENFGHTASLQLTWNSTRRQFEGKWSVQHGRYRGADKFELRFEDPSGALLHDALE